MSSSTFNYTSTCLLFNQFATSFTYDIASWVQIILASMSNALLLSSWLLFGITPDIEKNVKLLISYSYIFIICHNSFTLITQIRNQIVYSSAITCDLFPAWTCMIVRIPQLFCFIALTLTYLTLVFDRAYCTWKPSKYGKWEANSALSYLISIFIISFFLTCAVVIEYPIIPYRAYCSLTNESGSDRFNFLLRSLLVLSVAYSIVLIMLLIKNKQNMINNLHGFDVNTHYTMKSNQLAMGFVTVSSISSLLISVVFLGSNVFARAITENIGKVAFHAYLEYTYITPIHGFISAAVVIFYAFCRKKQMFTVNSTENLTKDHFVHLQKLWN